MEETNKETTPKKKVNYKLRVALVLVFVILVSLFMFVKLRGEYLNILSIGENYVQVFSQSIKYQYEIMGINFVVLFALIYFTTRFIKRGLKSFFEEDKIEMPKLPNKSIALIMGAIISIFVTPFIVEKTMLAVNAAQFGVYDPIFNMDISFYMFTKPFIEMLLYYTVFIFVVLSIYVAVYYIAVFNIYFDGINIETLKKSVAIKQIIFNVMVIVFALAEITFLSANNVIFEKSINIGSDILLYGGGLTDVTIKVWGYRILACILPIAVYLGIRYIKKAQRRKAITAFCVIPAYLVCLFIIMTVFQLMVVNPNELDKEKTYIENNIAGTKQAYNIETEEVEIANSGTLTGEQVTNNSSLLTNIPLVTEGVVLENLKEYQTSTGYYSYRNISLENYNINGKNVLCYIAPREITSDNGRTYNSKTYEYTHGYGAIITSASEFDEDNNITYIQKGLNGEETIKVAEPRIYFGIQTNQTIITNVKNHKEFDYPITSSTNAENVYDGQAGIKLNWLDRLILGIHTGNLKIAFNTNMTEDSKVITNRNIIERAKTVMPYLVYDENPYMVITDEGKQMWVLDAYTISNSYPYSQESIVGINNVRTRINYIRNSVKVIIDAYDGTMKFYITDRTDQIAMTYRNIYPELFVDKEEQIDESIAKNIKYPKFLYNIQSQMLNMYHNVQTEVLYRKDDIWDIAKNTTNKAGTSSIGSQMDSYYTVVKPANSEETKLGLVVPYTPDNKQNIIAYLVGTYENNDNKLTLYKFKSDNNILGPMQLENQVEQDDTISSELKTINVAGTKLVKNMLIVPIENTLLYVEPIYQVLINESQVPVLKKVVVASGNKVAIGNNLEEAVDRLVSPEATRIEIENTDDEQGLIEAIIKANNNLEDSNQNNNWELMGKDISRLQELIKQLEKLLEDQKKVENSTVDNTIQNDISENIIENAINNGI